MKITIAKDQVEIIGQKSGIRIALQIEEQDTCVKVISMYLNGKKIHRLGVMQYIEWTESLENAVEQKVKDWVVGNVVRSRIEALQEQIKALKDLNEDLDNEEMGQLLGILDKELTTQLIEDGLIEPA